MDKIAVLVSGGVDSAVAVERLVEEGYGPRSLHLFYIRIGLDTAQGGGCSAEEDIDICRWIARRHSLPFDVVDLHQEYWHSVMAYALRTVRAGLTPNPDIMCNRLIKLGYFDTRWGHAFDAIATGHYARVATPGGPGTPRYLATAPDPVKDQTDFLARITYSQLERVMFPIGHMSKAEVRQRAASAALPNALRRDSQGICFLGKIDYRDFLERHLGRRPGPIVDVATGRTLGSHQGYWFHTIGQRKGLGLSGGPWYVVGKDVELNTVYVAGGYGTELQYGRRIHLTEMHWITRDPLAAAASDAQPPASIPVTFKCRHTPEFTPATLTPEGPGWLRLDSEAPVQGIAPGQYAVIYDVTHTLCLGSGIITLKP